MPATINPAELRHLANVEARSDVSARHLALVSRVGALQRELNDLEAQARDAQHALNAARLAADQHEVDVLLGADVSASDRKIVTQRLKSAQATLDKRAEREHRQRVLSAAYTRAYDELRRFAQANDATLTAEHNAAVREPVERALQRVREALAEVNTIAQVSARGDVVLRLVGRAHTTRVVMTHVETLQRELNALAGLDANDVAPLVALPPQRSTRQRRSPTRRPCSNRLRRTCRRRSPRTSRSRRRSCDTLDPCESRRQHEGTARIAHRSADWNAG